MSVIAEIVATLAEVIVVKCRKSQEKKKQFNQTFIHWWKEDLKQKDLMNNLGKALCQFKRFIMITSSLNQDKTQRKIF